MLYLNYHLLSYEVVGNKPASSVGPAIVFSFSLIDI